VRVRIGALLLAAAALLTLPALRFDANPLAVRDPGTESVRAFHDVMEQGSTALLGIEVLAPDLRTAQTLASRLNDLESVDRTITLADYVPPDQEEKRLILEELSYFLALPPPDREMEPPPNDEVFAAIASLRERLSTLADEESDPRLRASGERLGKALGHFIPEPAAGGEALPLEPLERSLVPPIRNALARLQASLFPGPVTLDSLPSELRRRLETPDGRARIQVFPRADIEDPDAVEAFVDEVRSLTPQAVGEAVVIVESKRAVVGALRQALLAAVVMIGVLLFALWRRLSDTALVLTPLALAALLTCAVSVLADLPLNFADVIVLPLLLGIGVDSGIHLVNRYRHAPAGEERDVLGTSTARAVFWSGLTTVAGFGSLAFATHRGLASLGQLLTAGVALTLICNLVVLPALLTGRSSVGGAAGQGCDAPRSAP
jgi:hopanoid biosynthesis associated RND transporter like protein HpnN